MLVTQFQDIVDQLVFDGAKEQITFMYADDFEANLKTDGLSPSSFPIIVYDNRINTTETFTISNTFDTTADLKFFFLELEPTFDQTPLQSDIIIQRMRSLAKQFTLRLNVSDIVTPGKDIASITLGNLYKIFDATCSGVLLTVNTPINDPTNYCI